MHAQAILGVVAAAAQCAAAAGTGDVSRFYDVGFRPDIAYLGPGRKERLDLYFPKDPPPGKRFPGVVIIHGGGWTGGDKGDAREINIGSNLARAGYVCASINYVLAKRGKPCWPENLYDCKRAVQYLRVNAGKLHLGPGHIGCIGGSAGGHLSAMLGVCGPNAGIEPPAPYPGVSSTVQAAVDMYGIADMLNWQYTKPDGTPTGRLRDGSQNIMLGATRDQDPSLWKTASPIFQADPTDCPILILHGTADATVDYPQSVNFAKRLDKIGLDYEFHLIDGAHHTFDLRPQGFKHVDVRKIVLSFYDRHLRELSPAAAEAHYAALLAFEKAHPNRTTAGPWTGGPGTVKEVANTRASFVLLAGETSQCIAVEPAAVYVVERPDTLEELKNWSLVLLHGTKPAEAPGAFLVKSILRYAPDYRGWQHARDTRIVGRWYRKGNTLQVSVRGKKQPILLAPDVKISLRAIAKPDVLSPGARVVTIKGKRFGPDLFASRIVVAAGDR